MGPSNSNKGGGARQAFSAAMAEPEDKKKELAIPAAEPPAIPEWMANMRDGHRSKPVSHAHALKFPTDTARCSPIGFDIDLDKAHCTAAAQS